MLELFGQPFWKRTEKKHDHFKRVTYQRDAGDGLHRIKMTWACLDALPWPEREKEKSNILAFKEKAVWQSAKQLGISDPLSVTSECRGSSLKGSNLSCPKSDICVQHSCEVACTKNLNENAKNWREPTECVGNWWWWLFPHVHGFWEYVPQLIPHQHFFFSSGG